MEKALESHGRKERGWVGREVVAKKDLEPDRQGKERGSSRRLCQQHRVNKTTNTATTKNPLSGTGAS
jgi:hypothetical protein